MEQRPTKKQRELLSFIDGFIKGYGYGPSYREIMRALDYKSVSTVATHINGLITRGWLIKKDNSARTLEVVMPAQKAPNLLGLSEKTVENFITQKIDQLKSSDNEDNSKQIQTLKDALSILGYTNPDGKGVQ